MDLDLVRIECEIVVDIPIPVQLSAALHEALRKYEAHFKAVSCHTQCEACPACPINAGCSYRVVFAQQLSADPAIIRLHQKPSLPFSLYISETGSAGLSITVGLVILGAMVNYVETFHAALISMVKAAVIDVPDTAGLIMNSYCLDYEGVRQEITEASPITDSLIVLSGRHILQNTVHADSARLTINSPLRLLGNGAVSRSFDFALFFRSQLRRCSSLWAYYGIGEPDLDFGSLSLAAQNVAVLEDKVHYSQPPWSKKLNRGGLSGIIECDNLIEPMFSLLHLGSYFNAGKGAAFGSGNYKIEEL